MANEQNDPQRRPMMVRMPRELHVRLRTQSAKLQLSANQFVVDAIERECRRSETGSKHG